MSVVQLTDIPEDVLEIMLNKQKEIKVEKKTQQYSLARTVFAIIKEWDKIKKEKK